jgi:hypothetical protein
MPPLPPATLEVYYAPSCTPCRLELPVLAAFAERDGMQVHVVILSEESRAREELRAISPRLEASAEARSGASPNAVMREAGNADGILPFARAVTAGGETCAKWSGRLTLARARSLMAACARFKALPRSPRF